MKLTFLALSFLVAAEAANSNRRRYLKKGDKKEMDSAPKDAEKMAKKEAAQKGKGAKQDGGKGAKKDGGKGAKKDGGKGAKKDGGKGANKDGGKGAKKDGAASQFRACNKDGSSDYPYKGLDNSQRMLLREGIISEIPGTQCPKDRDATGKNVILVIGDGMVREAR
jgi:hypothetical protein